MLKNSYPTVVSMCNYVRPSSYSCITAVAVSLVCSYLEINKYCVCHVALVSRCFGYTYHIRSWLYLNLMAAAMTINNTATCMESVGLSFHSCFWTLFILSMPMMQFEFFANFPLWNGSTENTGSSLRPMFFGLEWHKCTVVFSFIRTFLKDQI